ncbi:hypothetical protein ACMYYO_11220 [Dermacoccaceae bacterium W4C1]
MDDTHAESLPKPKAQRLQRPSWRDARLLIGIMLIAAAALGGTAVVRSLDDSVEVYRAKTALVPGKQLSAADLESVRVRIDGSDGGYLSAARKLPSARVLREVRAGELVPSSAVGSPQKVGVKAVAIEVESSLAQALVVGSTVDLWVSSRQGQAGSSDYATPVRMVLRAVVSRVPSSSSSGFGSPGSSGSSVHVLIPDSRVAAVIGAVNSESRITVVPTADSPMRSGS